MTFESLRMTFEGLGMSFESLRMTFEGLRMSFESLRMTLVLGTIVENTSEGGVSRSGARTR
jgi:hypothetical protein